MPAASCPYSPGLEGVVAAQTAISSVDGEKGELVIRGFAVEDLAPHATFEETVFLLWHGALPDARTLDWFQSELAARRELERHTLELLRSAAAGRAHTMDALRMACGSLTSRGAAGSAAPGDSEGARQDGLRLVAAFPVIVAAYQRLSRGLEPIPPRRDLPHAANFLYMLRGREAPPPYVRALETYWNTVSDHGLNASTFTARVIVSTESDLVSAVTGAVGALKGRLHGGAPGPALDLVFEIGSAEYAERVLREKLARGERLMGFGHRVYRTRDPRADVLAAAAGRLFEGAGDRQLYELARAVEAAALRLLREHKPARALQTNVEFYTALVLYGIGFPTPLFTPVFAAGRVAGWTAHCLEQTASNRLIRPQSTYVGARNRRWVPVANRSQGSPEVSGSVNAHDATSRTVTS
ncbi:MAG TPA: citrate synthase/methylcitrate synthase [Vicinamibacterales bacterium]|nr:citrate synthase/methylcitrate synthase [Vicinamibacterales bacterium]